MPLEVINHMNRLAKEQGGCDYRMNDLSFSHLNGATVQDADSAVDNNLTDPVNDNDIVYDDMPEQDLSRFDLQQRDDDQIAGADPVTDSEVAIETVEIEQDGQPGDIATDEDGLDDHDHEGDAADDYFDDSPNTDAMLDLEPVQPAQPVLRKSKRSTARHDYKRANASGFVNSTTETLLCNDHFSLKLVWMTLLTSACARIRYPTLCLVL